MKTTLTVEVEYDPARTDPEGLACAMDRLMETALSIPGALDEYGNPEVGEFLIAGAALNPAPVDRPVSPPLGYELRIDGPLLHAQRRLLLRLLDAVSHHQAYVPKTRDERGLWEGLISLTDAIADQAHDRHGIDCLLDDEAEDPQDQTANPGHHKA
jgi:hypothetical protein